MFAFLKNLFNCCFHKWKIIDDANLFTEDKEDEKLYKAKFYILQCKCCGELKAKTFYYNTRY